MRKWWARISCLLLALLLVVSAVPVFAAGDESVLEEDAQEEVTDDFVILLDCSMSTSANDTQNLCLEACWDFLDKLPIYDTRVAIFTFGYEIKDDNENYDYYDECTTFEISSEMDMKLIHEIVPLSELNSSADKEEYKLLVQKALEENRTNKDTWTPYTHALAAVVDMLEKNTEEGADRNAAMILITDGVLDDRQDERDNQNVAGAEAERLIAEASERAGGHGWPIYSVQLNYGNGNINEIETAKTNLDQISANGAYNNVGRKECKNADDVFIALDSIFKDFKMLDIVPPKPVELPGSYYFEVGELTSEASIDIFGEGVESVSLYRVDENNERIKEYKTNIQSDLNDQRLIVSAGDGYYALKLICPDEGRWEAYIEGTGSVEVLVSENILSEMRLAIDAEPEIPEDTLTKNNTIEVHSYFTYHGIDKDNSDIYGKMPAVLKVFDNNNKVICTIDNNDTEYYAAEKTGYHFTLPLNMFPDEDAIRLQVVIEDSRFKDGAKRSTIKNFAFTDLNTNLAEDVAPMELVKHVGGEFKLDMRKIFVNPDGDPLVYTLTCENDAAVKFEYTMTGDEMIIPAGMNPGEYQMTIGVEGEAVKYDQLVLKVLNDAPWLDEELPEMVLWSDWYGFQDIGSVVNTLNLNEYFKDFEGMPLTYTLKSSEDGIVTVDNNNGELTLNPVEGVKKAEITVTVTAADGITPDSTATAELVVTVKSGKIIFWEQNWIYFAIAALIVLIIVVIIIFILKNKLVKGTWNITFDDNGNAEVAANIDIVGYTSVGKKGKFKLVDLLNELTIFLPDATAWSTRLGSYFSAEGASKIMLVGVTKRKGAGIANIPKAGGGVTVNVNGTDVSGSKASIYSGTLTFILEDAAGDRMVITMELQ